MLKVLTRKFAKKALKSISFSIAVLAICSTQPTLHNKYLRYEVGDSTVQVLGFQGGGSGFAIKGESGKDYIMTNRHVCDISTNGWVKIKSDKGLSVFKRIVYKDTIHDLCLVEGDSRLDALTLGSAPEKGDSFYIIGHPGLRQLTLSQGEYIGYSLVPMIDDSVIDRNQCTGHVYDLNPLQQFVYGRAWLCVKSFKSYSTTAVAYGGNSGSPVVNNFGNVIGVLFAGSTEQERDNFCVPLEDIKRVLAKF